MNQRHRPAPPHSPHRSHGQDGSRLARVALAALVFCGAVGAPAAHAQRIIGIPADVRSAASAKPHAATIQKFVAEQVKALADDKNVNAQQRARDALVREASAGGVTPSASFLDIYTTALNKELLPLAKSPSPRVRLNAAIVVQRVASRAGNARLAEAATAFAEDQSVGVSMWAVRAALPLLTQLAVAGNQTKLTGAVAGAVQRHPAFGDLADEAYKALTLNNNTKLITPKAVPVLLPDVMRLVESRGGQYVKQTPPKPDIDVRGINFLVSQAVLDTPEGTKALGAIVQRLNDLVGLTAQHAAAREGEERRPFIDQIHGLGDAMEALAKRRGVADPAVGTVGTRLKALQPTTPATEIAEAAAAAHEALRGKFPAVKPFPTMAEGAAVEPEENIIAEDEDLSAGERSRKAAEAAEGEASGTGTGGNAKPAATPKSSGTPAPKSSGTPAPKRPAATGEASGAP